MMLPMLRGCPERLSTSCPTSVVTQHARLAPRHSVGVPAALPTHDGQRSGQRSHVKPEQRDMSEVRCGLPGRFEVQIDGSLAMPSRRLGALQSLLPLTPCQLRRVRLREDRNDTRQKTQCGAQN